MAVDAKQVLEVYILVATHDEESHGGNWISLIAVFLAVVFFVPSLFGDQPQLQAVAYILWAISMLPIVFQLWQIVMKFDRETVTI